MIERRNILELIGKHRGKYHSCILTCYSLDFSFFEERVLPVLRTANIKNINVFADGKFLESAQENTTGREFRHNKTYNFLPIYATGVFHPKIMLLTGMKHGLLIIGSGNITSSGLNTNDEIWAAFHLNNPDNENAPLFSDVWEYLQEFLNQAVGFTSQKIEWIKKYSPWLLKLPPNNSPVALDSLRQTVSFVSNSDSEIIFGHLLKLVPKTKPKAVTIISPYYDLKGELLSAIYDHYKPEKINCVIDADFGLVPREINNDIKKLISFYHWKDCKDDYNETYNRLHAKIIHFQYPDGIEYMLLGSANATIAAMGSATKRPSNIEAGIIIGRQSKLSLLQELDIHLPGNNPIDIDSVPQNKFTLAPAAQSSPIQVRILYTELKGDKVTIYFKDKTPVDGRISIFSNNMIEIESLAFAPAVEPVIITCGFPEEVFKVCITDNTGNIISNYSIVHRFEYLLKCNPDPQQEKLDDLMSHDFPDNEGYTELLQYVDSNWADDESQNDRVHAHRSNSKSAKPGQVLDTKYDKLSAEKFNEVSNEVLLKQAGELTSANVKIADFLQIVSADNFHTPDDSFRESDEQKLFEDTDQRGEGQEVSPSGRPKPSGQKEKKAIVNYFKNLNEQYDSKLNPLYKTGALTESPRDEISIKNLSAILIALQLIQLYFGKKFTYEEENEIIEDIFLPEGTLTSNVDTVKGFMIDVFGKFLLIATGRFKTYDYEILNEKLNKSKTQVFIKSIFIVLNISWAEKESDYKNTLLLNILHFLKTDSISSPEFVTNLQLQLDKMKIKARYLNSSFQKNYDYLVHKILPRFREWTATFENLELRKKKLIAETQSIDTGRYIFSSRIGFNVVYKKSNHKGKVFLILKRAGYEWVEEKGACLLENIEYPPTCIIYDI